MKMVFLILTLILTQTAFAKRERENCEIKYGQYNIGHSNYFWSNVYPDATQNESYQMCLEEAINLAQIYDVKMHFNDGKVKVNLKLKREN